MAAQLRATLPADYDAHPDGAIPSGRLEPAVGEGGEPGPGTDGRCRTDVELWLWVENNNKFVRGKTKARARIEDSVLRPHAMRQPSANKNEYVLTLTYGTDGELDATVDDLLREAGMIADRYHCFTEADVRALDGSDRYW